jgi:hypothetical protein
MANSLRSSLPVGIFSGTHKASCDSSARAGGDIDSERTVGRARRFSQKWRPVVHGCSMITDFKMRLRSLISTRTLSSCDKRLLRTVSILDSLSMSLGNIDIYGRAASEVVHYDSAHTPATRIPRIGDDQNQN